MGWFHTPQTNKDVGAYKKKKVRQDMQEKNFIRFLQINQKNSEGIKNDAGYIQE